MPSRASKQSIALATFAILADSPWDAFGESAHRHGRNILYEDLHIEFVADLDTAQLVDNPYFNRMGRCEAGRDCDDAVVAPSYFPPLPLPARLTTDPK